MELEEAYMDGFDAGYGGFTYEDNPYSSLTESELHDMWYQGWEDGLAEYEKSY